MINPESLRRVFGLLRASFTHIVLDTSKAFTEVDLTAMELANDVVLIVQLDLPCLRNMVRLLMSFEEMDNIRDKVKIVVNRMGLDSGQISLKKARENHRSRHLPSDSERLSYDGRNAQQRHSVDRTGS